MRLLKNTQERAQKKRTGVDFSCFDFTGTGRERKGLDRVKTSINIKTDIKLYILSQENK